MIASWRSYLMEAKYECVKAVRVPGFIVALVLLPVALYLFFGAVMAVPNRTAQIDLLLFTGFAVIGAMGPGMFGFGVSVAAEREQGLLKLRRALPMPPAAYIVAKMFMAVLVTLVVTLLMIAAGLAVGKVSLAASRLAALAATLAVGALPFCAMGLLVGSRVRARSAPAFINLAYLPMIYLSGFLIPLPKSFDSMTRFSPAYHLDRLALHAVGAPTDAPLNHVLILAAVTVFFGGLAVRRLSRSE